MGYISFAAVCWPIVYLNRLQLFFIVIVLTSCVDEPTSLYGHTSQKVISIQVEKPIFMAIVFYVRQQ